MRFFLMHMDNRPFRMDPREEVALITPGSDERVVVLVPLGALERTLPLLAKESAGVDQACPSCGGDLACVPARDAC